VSVVLKAVAFVVCNNCAFIL